MKKKYFCHAAVIYCETRADLSGHFQPRFTMSHHSASSQFLRSLILVGVSLALVACGNKDDKKAASQVAARVGSDEISVHQINQVLSQSNSAGATAETVQAMSRQVLEKLIDQQLEVSQAEEKKLNRSPEVVAQIEAAKREILARAYLQQLVAALPKPTEGEARKYYAEHPALFAQRRLYNVQELIVAPQEGLAEQFKIFAASAKSLEDAAEWLRKKDIKFGGGSAQRSAEQIPFELLDKLAALKDGQTMVVNAPRELSLVRIVSSVSQPVKEDVALPRIQQFLGNQRANEAIAADIKQMRAATKVEYMGEFAKAPAAADADKAAGAQNAAASDKTAAPVNVAAQPAPAASASTMSEEDKTRALLEKGVSGLK
jgi:EpsD family peptidyl-prolyl cis-trans isomerase